LAARSRALAVRPGVNFLLFVQLLLLVCTAVVGAVVGSMSHLDALHDVVSVGIALVVMSVAAVTWPWHQIGMKYQVVVAVADLVLVTLLCEAVLDELPGLSVLILVPVLWLSYAFGLYWALFAIVGNSVVALLPFLRMGRLPQTVAEWGATALPAAIIAALTIAVHVVATRDRKRRNDLIEAYENLRVSVALGVDGDEALRVSVAEGVEGAEALRVSVAEGVEGAEALRVSVAEGVEGAEALRVSVAEGLDAASMALTVVDTVDAGITFYDPDGTIIFTNDTARSLVLASWAEDTTQASSGPLVFEDDRVTPIPITDYVFARAARGELVTRRSYWVGLGSAQRAVMATSQFVRRADGVLIGTVVATHDVTQLADAIEARDQFLTSVSHELRTPLTSIIGYLELIEDGIDLDTSGIGDEFAIVQRNTQRLLTLITDLLTTAEGQASLERRSVNVSEIAVHAMDAIRKQAAVEGVAVLSPNLPAILAEVDAARITDVLNKILSNAVKFTRPGGTVSLQVERVDRQVVVRITDSGIGMSPQEVPFVFDRFFRGSTSRSAEVAGTGLGLSTAKLIVESHHGQISASSVLGEGTTIEFRLPLLVGERRPSEASRT
jgi:signal transduction histidine kinase